MNKYSSKAIKTAATVGMSLAMVLSAMPAMPVMAVAADSCLIASESELNSVKRFIAQTKDVDWKTVTSESTIKADYQFDKTAYSYNVDTKVAAGTDDSVAQVADKVYPASIKINDVTLNLYTDADSTLGGGTQATTDVKGDASKYYYYATKAAPETITGKVKVNLIDYIGGTDTITTSGVEVTGEKGSDIATNGTAEGKKAVMYAGPASGFKTMLENVVKGCDEATTTKAETILDVYNAVTKTGRDLVTLAMDGEDATYDQITKIEAFLEKFDGNLTYDQKETLNAALENLYADESIDSSSDSYQTALTKFLDKATTDLEKVLTDSDYTDVTKSNAITTTTISTWVKDIKKNASYKRFKNEDSVIEFLESVEALTDDAKEVADAVNKAKNDSYKAYAKGTNSALKAVGKITYTTKDGLDTKELSIEEYNLLKDFKEDVVDMVLTMEAKKVGNRYVDKSTKSVYVTKTQFDKVMSDFGMLEDFVDTEDGKFVWDLVAEHMDKVIESLNTLEKDLPTLDAVTLQASDRNIITAADDAVYFLQKDGADNLTAAQARTVRDASRKVTELLEAYRMKFGSINTEVNGWVNKGNGDWTYYENGNAVTKWVASGSDWYYVKGGVMLRNSWIASDSQGSKWYYVDDAGKMVSNTTVNGYTFNSYGVWVK